MLIEKISDERGFYDFWKKKSELRGKTECQHDPNRNMTIQRMTGQRNPDSRHHLIWRKGKVDKE